MDWTEKQECVFCNEGGKLLVCSGDGCPISVHKSCMGCEAKFDDAGNFHCPYCVYKQITAETSRLREKVMLNKKSLSTFLEENIKDDNHQEPIVEMADKEEEISLKDKLVGENNLVSDDVPNHDVDLEKHQQSETPVPCDETRDTLVFEKTDVNMIMVIYKPKANPVDTRGLDSVPYKDERMKGDNLELDVSDGIKVEKQTGNDSGKFDEDADRQQQATSIEEEARLKDAVLPSSLEKKITLRKRGRLVTSNKNGNRRKEECVTEDSTLVSLQSESELDSEPNSKIDNDDSTSLLDNPNNAKSGSLEAKTGGASTTKTNDISIPEVKDSSKRVSVNDNDRSMKPPLQSRKYRVPWSEEEEDMLKEGVHKFSSGTGKNLPWKKILDFGRHIFDQSRKPSDLKDKWRSF